MSQPPTASWLQSRISVVQVEEGVDFAPKFDQDGLLPVVATDAASGEVLMMGVMNRDALLRSIETGEAHYWSRSRKAVWHKGATSGMVQTIVEMRIDDDQDALWLAVSIRGLGASCHVGYRSCFYRAVPLRQAPNARLHLQFREHAKLFNPAIVYAGLPNPTHL